MQSIFMDGYIGNVPQTTGFPQYPKSKPYTNSNKEPEKQPTFCEFN